MSQKFDKRIVALIENGINANSRSVVIILGKKGRDQVPPLYHKMKETCAKSSRGILWMHKKDFKNNKGKSAKKEELLEGLLSSKEVKFVSYKEVQNVLGQTFDMCVLQDYEALSPNILAQTIETVRGGGLVVFLLENVSSLRELITTKMDVHSRLVTEQGELPVPRFTERFILTLTRCQNCLLVDDKMQVVPFAENTSSLRPTYGVREGGKTGESAELDSLVTSLLSHPETSTAGSLIRCCISLDQAKTVLGMIGVITNKSRMYTAVATAARGRGKSASLGLSIAAAVAYNYGDIFLTAPSPDNLKTVFEYIKIGLDALGYDKSYAMIKSKEHDNFYVGVDIFKGIEQKVKYINPRDYRLALNARVVCIDEAAAIPMMYVKEMMQAPLVLMTSTVSGYEGTGRSLSHKLIGELRQRVSHKEVGVNVTEEVERIRKNLNAKEEFDEQSARSLLEMELKEPIRYGSNDAVERWLNSLLCLNISGDRVADERPYPGHCELYHINKDTLFSCNEKTEEFLQELISIFAASHYKNSPNDVQLLSDAPNHHIFCLMGPNGTILCAIQVAYEGGIPEEKVADAFRKGTRGDGGLVPWVVEEKCRVKGFAQKLGIRVVRIATYPGLQKGGYGSRAMDLLIKYYEGKMMDMTMTDTNDVTAQQIASAHKENQMKPRSDLRPIAVEVCKRRPEMRDYISASFGLNEHLLRFWKKQGMSTVHVGLTKNPLTWEHNCITMKSLNKIEEDGDDDDDDAERSSVPAWLAGILDDFKAQHIQLLRNPFRDMRSSLALEILRVTTPKLPVRDNLTDEKMITESFSLDDDVQLDGYLKDLVDEERIFSLVSKLTLLVFGGQMEVRLTEDEKVILVGMGLQKKSADEMKVELQTTTTDAAKMIFKQAVKDCIKKKMSYSQEVQEKEEMREENKLRLQLADELEEDMEDAVEIGMSKHKALEDFHVSDLQQYAFAGGNDLQEKELRKMNTIKLKTKISSKRKAGDGEGGIVKKMKRNLQKFEGKKRKHNNKNKN